MLNEQTLRACSHVEHAAMSGYLMAYVMRCLAQSASCSAAVAPKFSEDACPRTRKGNYMYDDIRSILLSAQDAF